MELLHYIASTPVLIVIIGILAGASIGSFLNVVIYRLPLMMFKEWSSQCKELQDDPTLRDLPPGKLSLAYPSSTCTNCGTPIPAYHNIPILSYLFLRGKCSTCGYHYGPRYFYIELLSALVGGYLLYEFGITGFSLCLLLYTFLLIPLIFIDIDYKLLPDSITYMLLWAGISASLLGFNIGLDDAVLGVMLGYLSLWIVYILFKLMTGKEGMGHGDFKLLAAIGAWVGWQQLLTVILLSSISGTIIGIWMLLHARKNGKEMSSIPFGPFLAIGGWLTLLWGTQLKQLYFSFF